MSFCKASRCEYVCLCRRVIVFELRAGEAEERTNGRLRRAGRSQGREDVSAEWVETLSGEMMETLTGKKLIFPHTPNHPHGATRTHPHT